MNDSHGNAKGGGESVKRYEGDHQEKDALGDSRLRRSERDILGVNVLNLLLVSVQDEDHRATGPQGKQRNRNFR